MYVCMSIRIYVTVLLWKCRIMLCLHIFFFFSFAFYFSLTYLVLACVLLKFVTCDEYTPYIYKSRFSGFSFGSWCMKFLRPSILHSDRILWFSFFFIPISYFTFCNFAIIFLFVWNFFFFFIYNLQRFAIEQKVHFPWIKDNLLTILC